MREQMTDLISRQAAIDALYAEMPGLNPVAMDIILALPSAEPEPCDFCANRDDCEDMRIYCPARPNDATAQFTGGSKTGGR